MHDDLRWVRFAFHWALGSLVLYVALVLGAAYLRGATSFVTALTALVGALIGGGSVALAALLLRRRHGVPAARLSGTRAPAMEAEVEAAATLRRQWLWAGFIWALTSLMFFAQNTLAAAHQSGSVYFARVVADLMRDLAMGALLGSTAFVLARHRRRTRSRPGADLARDGAEQDEARRSGKA